MFSSLRLYAYLAIAIAALGGAWYVHHLRESNAELSARADTAESQLIAERNARKHEKEIADAAANQFHANIETLQADLASRPLKPVYIRVPVHAMPAADRPTGAASGADESTQGREPGTTEVDIAAELTEYALDCQINSLQLEALQSWVRSR